MSDDESAVETRVSYNNKYNIYDYFSSELVYYLHVYYTIILIVFGLIGNAISLMVFRFSRMWKLSIGRYLSALALTDSFFLVQLLVAWMETVNLSDMFNWNGLCQASVYTSYVSCNLSAWLVVAFTVERLVAVKWPLRRGAFDASRATTIVQVLTGVSLTVNLPVLRFATATPHCNLDARYRSHADAFNMLDTVISFTIPLAAIVVMNILICAGLLRAQRQRRRMVVNMNTDVEQHQQRRRGEAENYKVNAMLLTVSTVFVLLNLPAYSIRVLAYKIELKNTLSSRTRALWRSMWLPVRNRLRRRRARRQAAAAAANRQPTLCHITQGEQISTGRFANVGRRLAAFRPNYDDEDDVPPPPPPPRVHERNYARRYGAGFRPNYDDEDDVRPPPPPPRVQERNYVRRYGAGIGGGRFIEGYVREPPIGEEAPEIPRQRDPPNNQLPYNPRPNNQPPHNPRLRDQYYPFRYRGEDFELVDLPRRSRPT